jgi:hypothetical protein
MGFVQQVPGAIRFPEGLAAKTSESLERVIQRNIIAITGPIKASTGPRYGMICSNAASRAQSDASGLLELRNGSAPSGRFRSFPMWTQKGEHPLLSADRAYNARFRCKLVKQNPSAL